MNTNDNDDDNNNDNNNAVFGRRCCTANVVMTMHDRYILYTHKYICRDVRFEREDTCRLYNSTLTRKNSRAFTLHMVADSIYR